MSSLVPIEKYDYDKCVMAAGAIISAYPKLFLEDEVGFQGRLAVVLMDYPRAVVDDAVKNIPSMIPKKELELHSVRQYCNEAAKPIYEARRYQREQLQQERAEAEHIAEVKRDRLAYEAWQKTNPGKSRYDYLGITWRPGKAATIDVTPYIETEWGAHSQAMQDREAQGTVARSLGMETE
jgi:hypothetical protein